MKTIAEEPRSELAERHKRYIFKPPIDSDPYLLERRTALLLIMGAAWYLRAMNPGYSSAYMDESVYIVYGRMFLSRHLEGSIAQPLRWTFGWYLWPMMAAIVDRLGGIIAVRELAAAMGTATVGAVYGFARRLFSPAVGLASAAAYAVLAPAVYSSRIATRDCAALFFFALGLWLFARAWQENGKGDWLAAGASFFAGFLCKYIVAIFFPFLVILAIRKKLRPVLFFTLPLALLCAGYLALYRCDLIALLRYGSTYGSLRAPATQAWQIYLGKRLDFWLLAILSCLSLLGRNSRKTLIVLWTGAAIFLAFQWKTRADYDYWKHVAYPMVFLTPPAMGGFLALMARIWKRNQTRQAMASVAAVVALCGVLGWAGKSWSMEQFVFWPNVEPALAFMEGKLIPADWVLVDDSVFRYYFQPPLQQRQITDPFYFWYKNRQGDPAYATAVRDGVFEYVVLDGGIGEDAQRMQAAIRPVLNIQYELCFSMPEPQLNHTIEIYARKDLRSISPSRAPQRVTISFPQSDSLVQPKGIMASVKGKTYGSSSGWHVQLDVFTNRWYAQPDAVLHPDGSFFGNVYLGGDGEAQCHHLIRARLFDKHGNPRAVDLVYHVIRANPDGMRPQCR